MIIAWGAEDVTAAGQYAGPLRTVLAGVLVLVLMLCSRVQAGYWQNSRTLFEHTLSVTQDNVIAHFQLGLAFDQQGQLNKALFQYSRALEIDPNYTPAHTNIGAILTHKGDIKGAFYHYYEALRQNPGDYGAYSNLGAIWAAQGKTRQAIGAFKEALRLRPDMTQSLYHLAWIYATHAKATFRNGPEALKLAARLCRVTNYADPLFLDALAAAYAEVGRFDEAARTAQKGLDLALRADLNKLAAGLKKRLKLYQAGHPFRQASR
jgi:tetratricopeptide (TPR) repeat protein